MSAVLHVISDKSRPSLPLHAVLIESAKGGADVLQIREKRSPASETLELCQDVRRELQAHGVSTSMFVNDRVDVALAADLDGVHLAAKSLPVNLVKELGQRCGWTGKVGVSVHSLEEALAAEASGASYVTFGHIYDSESKRGLPPRGVRALERIVDALSIPVVAVGGIDKTNIQPVLMSGVSGIAVIGAVVSNQTPRLATEQLKNEIEKASCTVKVPFF